MTHRYPPVWTPPPPSPAAAPWSQWCSRWRCGASPQCPSARARASPGSSPPLDRWLNFVTSDRRSRIDLRRTFCVRRNERFYWFVLPCYYDWVRPHCSSWAINNVPEVEKSTAVEPVLVDKAPDRPCWDNVFLLSSPTFSAEIKLQVEWDIKEHSGWGMMVS